MHEIKEIVAVTDVGMPGSGVGVVNLFLLFPGFRIQGQAS
jgi:hypothetical protein